MAVALLVVVLACSSREAPGDDDAGTVSDSGSARDGGPRDAGTTPRDGGDEDAGAIADAGPTPRDSGPAPSDAGPTPRDAGPLRPDSGDCACPNSGTCMREGQILCAPAPDYPCLSADGWYAECTESGWVCRFTTPAIC